MQDDFQKKRRELRLILTIVFLSGIIIGAIVGVCIGVSLHMRINEAKYREKPHMKNRLLEHLSQELSLTEEQQKKVATCLEEMQKTKEFLFRENMKKVREHIQKSFDSIEKILNPDQLKKFKEFRNRMKERFKGKGKDARPSHQFRRHHYRDNSSPAAAPPPPPPPPGKEMPPPPQAQNSERKDATQNAPAED